MDAQPLFKFYPNRVVIVIDIDTELVVETKPDRRRKRREDDENED